METKTCIVAIAFLFLSLWSLILSCVAHWLRNETKSIRDFMDKWCVKQYDFDREVSDNCWNSRRIRAMEKHFNIEFEVKRELDTYKSKESK